VVFELFCVGVIEDEGDVFDFDCLVLLKMDLFMCVLKKGEEGL